ncbi:MAG: nucleotidyltransferase domain-containing protein [Pseudonocardiaceae bacterium]
MTPDELATSLRGDPALRDVRLLVLHGSRAGEAGSRSDWDLGYLTDPGADLGALAVAITSTLRSDRVDLADLATASALLLPDRPRRRRASTRPGMKARHTGHEGPTHRA